MIASFGVVNEIKQNALLVAVAARGARAVSRRVARVRRALRRRRSAQHRRSSPTRSGVGDACDVTGAVTAAEYASWLDRAAVAVQLRRTANGESSAAVADCLAAGAVLVVTGIGAGRDLPDDGVSSP